MSINQLALNLLEIELLQPTARPSQEKHWQSQWHPPGQSGTNRALGATAGLSSSADMVSWLPKRFSIRTLLILIALVAFALVSWREWTQWNEAHYRFERALAAWKVGNIRTSDVVDGVEALYDAESRTIWMPRSTARKRHAERLSKLADGMEVLATLSMSLESIQDYRKFAEQLRAKVADLSSDDVSISDSR